MARIVVRLRPVFFLLMPIAGSIRDTYASTLIDTDSLAFYCGARVVAEGHDPYLTAPLHTCQATYTLVPGMTGLRVLDPAPQPAYDFVLLYPLTKLPFVVAAAVWTALSIVCIACVAFLVSRLASLPFVVVLASFAVVEGYRTISYGQLPPFTILALCTSAWFLTRNRGTPAGIAAVLSMTEPHIGLPACLALFCWAPATRMAMLGGAMILSCLTILSVGVDANIQYFTQVLPVHQISELGSPIQYSLTYALHELHAGDRFALLAGTIDYLAMLALGAILAPRIASALGSKAAVVLFPPAIAMLGGPFVHLFEIGVALPFALLVAGRAPKVRTFAWGAVIALALDWPAIHAYRLNVLEAFAIVTLAIYLTRERAAAFRGAVAIGALVGYFGIAAGVSRLPNAPLEGSGALQAGEIVRYDARLASSATAMEQVRDQRSYPTSIQTVVGKLPTWLALMVLLALSIALALGSAPAPGRRQTAGLGQITRERAGR